MLLLSPLRNLGLAIFAIAAITASASPSVAADPDTRKARLFCWWDGTAPFCDGECKSGQRFEGAWRNEVEARNALNAIVPGVKDSNLWRDFGKDCETGTKALCCLEVCPNGYTMINGECKNVSTKTRDLELPLPGGQAPYEEKLKKGGIIAPGPAEELKKGPVIVEPEEPAVTKRKTAPIME